MILLFREQPGSDGGRINPFLCTWRNSHIGSTRRAMDEHLSTATRALGARLSGPHGKLDKTTVTHQ